MSKKSNKAIDNYKLIRPLADYIDRIGAEQLNFRRFMVKEHKGHYYTEKSLIIIDKDGVIKSTKKDYAPTSDEAKAIQEALAKIEWPSAIGTKNIDALLKVSKAKKENLFTFFSRKTRQITFVQERRVADDGSKSYLPWSFFSDGEWRSMEPDGKLPFWKPEKRISAKIMIHEGAKAARHIDWLVNSKENAAVALRASHPWIDDLMEYEHWGMIGGALAPHRADYSELEAEKPTETVYICDNDWPGKKALEDISYHWGRSLLGVYLDNRWPASWDLADKFEPGPEMARLFAKSGRYIGPGLKALMFSATYATEMVPNPSGEGKAIIAMRKPFMEEWFHCVRPEVFVHGKKPNVEYSLTEFNNIVSPFSHSRDTGSLLKKDLVHKSANLCYDPSRPQGPFVTKEGHIMINMHVPTYIKAEKGSAAPFEEYTGFLFSDNKDRMHALRWCATLIARPDIKMHYGILLISETQGVGKTTLGQDILAPLVGTSNVSFPSEVEIVENQFNYWCSQKRLAIVNEIYAGQSTKAYDKLKSVITDTNILVNKKYQAAYEIENWTHVFACSNSFRALKLGTDDRRWFVPQITEKKHDTDYWTRLHDWLDNDNGLGKIKYWAQKFTEKNGVVRPGDAAPWSKVKQEVIEATMSPGMVLVSGYLDRLKEHASKTKKGIIVADTDLVQLIKDKLYDGRPTDRLERPLTIRKLARSKGWFISAKKVKYSVWGPKFFMSYLLFSSPSDANSDPETLAANGRKPFDLKEMEDF